MSVTDRILTALTTVIRMNDKVEEMAGLMRQQQRRLDDLNGRAIRLETVLELALSRVPGAGARLLEGGPVDPGPPPR
jgi:galactokinase